MLYIDAKELREKGSIVLLQDGDLLVAINDEMIKVLNDVENPKTDTKEKKRNQCEVYYRTELQPHRHCT